MKRCHQCGGKFGLIRHHYLRHPFCSRPCVERFHTLKAEEILDHKRTDFKRTSHTLGCNSEPTQLDRRR